VPPQAAIVATGASETQQQVAAIRELLHIFRYERVVYLGITLLSVAMLLATAVNLFVHRQLDAAEVLGLFGPTGVIAFSSGRLLRMWTEAVRVLQSRRGSA
jgi:hypothetical protein